MSYASVIGQQTLVPTLTGLVGRTIAGTLQTVYSIELTGNYAFTCIFEIDGQAPNADSDMRVGNLKLEETPNVADFTRTLSGVAQTGLFEIKQKYRDETNYFIQLRLLKLT
jgi:hypothetical protein